MLVPLVPLKDAASPQLTALKRHPPPLTEPFVLVLATVLEIHRPDGPLDPVVVTEWQVSNTRRFQEFMSALDKKEGTACIQLA
eukprot:5249070-Amphidinium_carterae.1